MTPEAIANIDPSVARLIVAAIESDGLILECAGALYLCTRYGDEGWWVYQAEPGAPEYFVDARMHRCTCWVGGDCKHIRGLMEALNAKARSL